MKLLEAIRNELLTDDTVVSKVVDRIFPVSLPEPASGSAPELPAITTSIVFGSELPSLAERSGVSNRRVQFCVWGHEFDEALAVREAIKDKLLYFTGYMGGSSPSYTDGLVVLHAHHSGEYDRFEPAISAYMLFLDMVIMHREEL